MKRRQPTPKERKLLHDHYKGLCACGCAQPLGAHWIAEHVHPLGLGGDNRLIENVRPYRIECAAKKTNGTKATSYGSDKHAMAKAKRLAAGGRKRKGPKLRSRGFDKSLRRGFDGKVTRR